MASDTFYEWLASSSPIYSQYFSTLLFAFLFKSISKRQTSQILGGNMSFAQLEYFFVIYIIILVCFVLYLLREFLYWSEILELYLGISFITIFFANKVLDKLGYPQYSLYPEYTKAFLIVGIILLCIFALRLIFHPRRSLV